MTIPCSASHRVIENTKETRTATCREKVNWITFSRDGAHLAGAACKRLS
jgi:hypothetical protein